MGGMTRGALWIIFGTSLIAFSDNFVGNLSREIGLWQFHAMRSAMVIPIAALFALAIGQLGSLRPSAPGPVIMRSLFGTAGLVMYFAALPAVGIAQTAAGFFTAPIWVALLSALIFRERVGPRRILGVAIGFAGVCLVLGLGAEPLKPLAVVAVAGGGFWALNVIWTRRYCGGETAVCLAIWQFIALFLAGLVGLTLVPWLSVVLEGVPGAGFATMPWRPLGWSAAGVVFLIGMAGITATGCQARGYLSGASSIMALFDFAFLFWAPFFAWMIWGDVVSPRVGLGMGLIVIAGALAIWSAARAEEAN
jgi:drug/metabolite transporter (DMT)-like permease